MSTQGDDPIDAEIHLRVYRSRKARWVRESRAEGKRLTDWIVERVERPEPNEGGLERKEGNERITDS